MAAIRVNKYIRETGLFSRREADQAILDGRVSINGKLAKAGDLVKDGDLVKLDGEKINPMKKPTPRKKVLPPAVNPKSKVTRANQREQNRKKRK